MRPAPFVLLMSTFLAAAPLAAQDPRANAALKGAPTPTPAYRAIAWDALMAPGWDGMREFRRLDLGALNDNDPRAGELLRRMRESWDRAPVNMALIGQAVRIAGYVVPLDESAQGLREFLLVPYYGACIHTPPPPANQIVHVRPRQPLRGIGTMDTVWVAGVLGYARTESILGTSSWSLGAADVQRYGEALKATPLR